MKHFFLLMGLLSLNMSINAQTEKDLIEKTLLNYINGTSYNDPRLIEKAFHQSANLYLDKKDEDVWIVPIHQYISWYKNKNTGEFTGRHGTVLDVDYFKNIATAKAEIWIPEKNLRYIDMFLLKKIDHEWKIISKTASGESSTKTEHKILFIVSNASFHGTSNLPTGNSFSEIVNAYDTFMKAGFSVDFVSPQGGSIPLAYINTSDSIHKKLLYNKEFMYQLKHTKRPDQITPKNYQAVHYIGGGSAMYDVPINKDIQNISMAIYEENGGIISSVCHGTAGIVNLKTKDGKYLVEGKTISGYPETYEREGALYFEQFPFLIQKTIEERGGIFKYAPRNQPYVEVQGNVITGQNYLSSKEVALKIIENIKNRAL